MPVVQQLLDIFMALVVPASRGIVVRQTVDEADLRDGG